MFSEGRVTRSRARLTGEATPLCSGLPDGKTPGTRTTRRRAATKEIEQPTPRAALFDLTNAAEEAPATIQAELPPVDETKPFEVEESPAAEPEVAEKEAAPEVLSPIVDKAATEVLDPILEEAAPIAGEQALEAEEEVMASSPVPEEAPAAEVQEEAPLAAEDSVPAVAREASEEAPATPPPAALPASPVQAGPAPTPTGLGLSSMAPMSPLGMPLNLAANTPMATPLHGVPATAEAKVFDMLNAAAKAMEEHGEAPAEEAPASAAPMRGFGSPVKFSESPAMSVSFGGPDLSLGCSMQQDEAGEEVASRSPAGIVGMVSPAMDFNTAAQASPVPESPTMFSTAAATPDMPQEAYDQEADLMEEMSLERPVSMPAPTPEAVQQEAAKPKLRSKVAVASPFDPRSLRQLRKEIKEKAAQKEAASAANSEAEDEEYEDGEEYYEAEEALGSNELLAAMGNLNLGSPEVALDPYTLRGLPKPAGQHIRFEDDGTEYVSPKLKTKLRGLPTPHGKHQYFSDDDE